MLDKIYKSGSSKMVHNKLYHTDIVIYFLIVSVLYSTKVGVIVACGCYLLLVIS